MRFILRVLALTLLPLATYAAPYTALKDGEFFRYRVSWGIFRSAGEVLVSAKREAYEGRQVYRVAMTTSTRGIIRGFYNYDETAVATIDAATGRILIATDVADHNAERMSNAVTHFDYVHRTVSHRDPLRPGRNCDYSFPAGDPIDLISALIQARDWADKPGLQRRALVFAGRDIYPIMITAERYENVETARGFSEALLLIPRMVDEAPRGVFKRGGEIKVWVAENGDRLPVKMQLKLQIGTAQLTLVEHGVAASQSALTAAASGLGAKVDAGN